MIPVIGDVHTHFWAINNLVNKEENIEMILQVGDLGWYPRTTYSYWKKNKLELGKAQMFFCEGNHDDLEVLMPKEDSK